MTPRDGTKIIVVSDEHGNLVSVSPSRLARPDADLSTAGKVPRPGQQVHEIELAGDIASMSLHEIHRRYRVERVEGEDARLVDRD